MLPPVVHTWLARLAQAFHRPAARWSRLFALGIIVGILAGLAAAGLHWALEHGSALIVGRITHLGGADVLRFHWGVLLLPALGGLASGLMVHGLAPHAFGHGTDALVRAFHRDFGNYPLRGPLVKGVSAVGVISCGGSTGPEGPIAALGSAIGSTIGRLFRVSVHDRRVLLIAGCAAGVGAIFRCPLGGAIFAAGILYSDPEFETDAIVPGVVASVIGYSTFMLFSSAHTLEPMIGGAEQLVFSSPAELLPYALLGPLCGLTNIVFCLCMRTMERRVMPRLKLPRWFAPAVGGLLTGALACLLPQVMDGQYLFIKRAVSGELFGQAPEQSWWWWARLFASVAVVKCAATALTVGSGGSGGVLGPSVFMGGAVGAFLGAFFEAAMPGVFPESLRRALIPVGMGGVLAATMRTPLASIIMVTEMTGSYGLIVPLMLVCVSSYVVGRRWGLNAEQVRSAAESPAHAADGIIHMLEGWRVSQFMDTDHSVTAAPDEPLTDIVRRITPGTRPVFAVLNGSALAGLISVPDIRRIMEEPVLAESLIASDIMTEELDTVYPADNLYQALEAFRRNHHNVLPVISRDGRRRWLGMLTRQAVFEALRRQIAERQVSVLREHAGLSAIDQEGQMQQLLMAVSPARTDRIQRLLVPLQAVGQSLRAADFRRRFGVQVIAIEMADGSVQCPPELDAPLRTDQRLLAVVWENATLPSRPPAQA